MKALHAYLMSSAVRRLTTEISTAEKHRATPLFVPRSIMAAHHHQRRLHEVLDGAAFAQEFRIGHYCNDPCRLNGATTSSHVPGKTVLRTTTVNGLVRPASSPVMSAVTRRKDQGSDFRCSPTAADTQKGKVSIRNARL